MVVIRAKYRNRSNILYNIVVSILIPLEVYCLQNPSSMKDSKMLKMFVLTNSSILYNFKYL